MDFPREVIPKETRAADPTAGGGIARAVYILASQAQRLIGQAVKPDRRRIRHLFLRAETFARIPGQSRAVPR
jgi:hypothetical protein